MPKCFQKRGGFVRSEACPPSVLRPPSPIRWGKENRQGRYQGWRPSGWALPLANSRHPFRMLSGQVLVHRLWPDTSIPYSTSTKMWVMTRAEARASLPHLSMAERGRTMANGTIWLGPQPRCGWRRLGARTQGSSRTRNRWAWGRNPFGIRRGDRVSNSSRGGREHLRMAPGRVLGGNQASHSRQ